MSKAARSVYWFGLYLLVAGIGFLLIPNVLLPVFGAPTTEEPWIRLVGILVLVVGYYYVRAGQQELHDFFPFTVQTRVAEFVAFLGLVLLRIAPPSLIMFGVADLLGAIWTQRSLSS